jgi:hypothetical protein
MSCSSAKDSSPKGQVAADPDQGSSVEHVYWNSDDDPLSQPPLLEQLRRG